MATTKPRITITLTTRQHEVLKSIGAASGQSMSGFVVDILEMALPTLERLAATLQHVRRAHDQDVQRIRDQLEEAQSAFEPIALAAVGQADLFLGRIGAAFGDGGLPAAPKAAVPPPTNRGVTPPHEKPLKPSPGAASRPVGTRSRLSKKGGVR
jgi:uncharacterized protein (DUF1778 family)